MATNNAGGTPVGTVLMYAGGTDGSSIFNLMSNGWVLCDGSIYGSTQFPELFTAIGESYGGSGAGFAVPTYKGLFLRGVDATDPLNRDPDAASRTAPRPDLANQGNNGDAAGSLQMDQFESHAHNYQYYNSYIKSSHTAGHECLSGQAGATSQNTGTGSDTRPLNQYVNFIIKAVSSPDAVPIGAVIAFAGDITKAGPVLTKAGWLFCNGAKQTTASFQALYQVIANYFGADDQNSFRLPDFRGKFVRGVVGQLIPGTSSLDPDYLTRTAPQPTLAFPGNTGNQVGSMQVTAYVTHNHSYTYNNDYWNTAATAIGAHAETNSGQTWTSATNSSLSESRPINIGVNYLIKAVAP
jgi:microcystin-dependent protein